MNVLIVEDDITTRLVLTRHLQERGHAIVACESAEQARVFYSPDRFQLIILDLMLPGMNGLALGSWIRHQPHGDMPYILVVTAKNEEQDLLNALAAGANDYLHKPNLVDQLAVRLAVAEQSIRELSKRRTAEEISQTILQTAPDGFWMLDGNGNVLSNNESLSRILHRSQADLVGIHHEQFFHPADQEFARRKFKDTILQGESRFSCRGIRPDGTEILLEISSKFLDQLGGRVVAFLKDVTEQHRVEERLRQAQKMDSIGRLAAGVAHDFNNVLTVIQGRAALLGITASGPDIESIQEISSASELGGDLTRQLLTFSRQRPASLEPMDLNGTIIAFQRMIRRILGDGIDLKTELEAALPKTQSDRGMIEQILLNLAANARDAMPGGGQFTLKTFKTEASNPYADLQSGMEPRTYACLQAKDTGIGIANEAIPNLFEPFFTTKEQGKGTGLGLAVVYGIVKQHSGWIEVESAPGAGATFKIFLPLAAAGNQSEPAKPRTLKLKRPAKSRNDRVLLVEDDPSVAALANCVLSLQGFEVHTADSGPTALEVWKKQGGRFDLLLTDIMMPGGMNGQDVADILRQKDPSLKVLYMSGYNPEIIRLEGNANFLAKPCHPGTLSEAVHKALQSDLPG